LDAHFHAARNRPDNRRQLEVLAAKSWSGDLWLHHPGKHLHFIASAPDIDDQIARFKSYTALEVMKFLTARNVRVLLQQLQYLRAKHKTDRDHQVWQEGSHPQMIQDDAMMWQKLEYMHNNPVERGYVEDPTHWRYSSARNYAGLSALLTIRTDWM
jgi:putative transposase